MDFSIKGTGAGKADHAYMKRQEEQNSNAQSQRDQVAYASIPGLLNGSNNPSPATHAGFNA